MDFKSLKKSSSSSLDKLNNELTKLAAPSSKPQDDDRFWKPEVDKAGNGYAVIRFLPAPGGEDVPFVRLFDHAFKGPGGWLIDGCLTSVNEKCPVCEHNSALWNTGTKENQATVRNQKRKLSFISNIYIVKDPAHPENEGKVKLFKYGKKIFDKLNAAMNPEFEDETPLNPFDMWAGANFKLKIRKVDGYPNYDKSEFESAEALSENDDELEAIWKHEFPLQTFLERSNFKTHDELKARLSKALGLEGAAPVARQSVEDSWEEQAPAAAPRKLAERPAPVAKADVPWDDTEEDDLAMFQQLAEDK
ncbi:single-stranded DNA-binding protein [bacterium]|nr:single-stranded DNA-binding protein [bacterium]